MDVRDRSESTACCSLGAAGGDEVVVVPWPQLIRHRVQHRVEQRVAGSDRYRWWVLFAVMAGLFSINVTFTVFAVALPRVARGFHTDVNTITWVITGPLLAFGVTAPALGRAGDLWGHKRVYVIAMAGAVLTAVLSAAAWSAGSLIAARTLDGIEGAATGAASMALIFRAFPPEDRVKAMGWWSLVGAGGPGDRRGRGRRRHPALRLAVDLRRPGPADPRGVPGALGHRVAHHRPGRNHGTRLGRRHHAHGRGHRCAVRVEPGPGVGVDQPRRARSPLPPRPVAALLFVIAERRAAEPLLPLEYLRRRNFAFPIATQAMANFAYMGGFILAPLLLANLFGYKRDRSASS